MNKKLLGLLMLPTLALASCSGGFKKVKYFKAGADEYITEKVLKFNTSFSRHTNQKQLMLQQLEQNILTSQHHLHSLLINGKLIQLQ